MPFKLRKFGAFSEEEILGFAEHIAPRSEACGFLIKRANLTAEYSAPDEREGALKALFCALKSFKFLQSGENSLPPFEEAKELFLRKSCGVLPLALFAAACLERLSLRPVLAFGKSIYVGVWLYESSFFGCLSNENETVKTYLAPPLKNLVFFCSEDLFVGGDAFLRSETKLLSALACGETFCFLDVAKLRKDGIPAPFEESEKREEYQSLLLGLADFSARGSLLDFQGKDAVKLFVPDFDTLLLYARTRNLSAEPSEEIPAKNVLIEEESAGMVRTERGKEKLFPALEKRCRLALEETGANIGYFAYGMLSYSDKGKKRTAPLLLAPAKLYRGRGKRFAFASSGTFFINFTLVSYLSEEYGLNISFQGYAAEEILEKIRGEISCMPLWQVKEECCFSAFRFQRDLMWNDLKTHEAEYLQNPLFQAACIKKRALPAPMSEKGARFLPLPLDQYQQEAMNAFARGESFLLSGPPGTGKSQTIAAMLLSAMNAQKSVLFCAEKRAALSVVYARLKALGFEKFCLLLEPDTDSGQVFQKAENTVKEALSFCMPPPEEAENGAFEKLALPYKALHERTQTGYSVFEMTELALAGKRGVFAAEGELFRPLAPIPNCPAPLSEKQFSALKENAALLVPSARAMGKNAALFESVKLCDCALKEGALYAAKALLVEAGRLRESLFLLLECLGQRLELVTKEKLSLLAELVRRFQTGEIQKIFGQENFIKLYAAHKRLAAAEARIAKYGASENTEKTIELKREERAARLSLLTFDIEKKISGRRGISEEKRAKFFAPASALIKECEALFSGFAEEAFFRALKNTDSKALFSGFLRAEKCFSAGREAFIEAAMLEEKLAGEDVIEWHSSLAAAMIEGGAAFEGLISFRRAELALSAYGILLKAPIAAFQSFSEKEAEEAFLSAVFEGHLALLPKGALLENYDSEFSAATQSLYQSSLRRAEFSLNTRLVAATKQYPEEYARFLRLTSGAEEGGVHVLFEGAPNFMKAVFPCLLLSPSAAAQYLPAKHEYADAALFDEASQLTLSEGAGVIARAKQLVVTGDEKQLPPMVFFRAGKGKHISLLTAMKAAGFPERELLVHYRSRHESLIRFCNERYYGGRLCTFPAREQKSRITLVHVKGVYARGEGKYNREEAEAVVREAVMLLLKNEKKSLGIVTLSLSQQEEIEKLLLGELSAKGLTERAFGGEEPLFVKNLENVQGDERDIILFSVGYGRDSKGKFPMNFGPLSKKEGGRRLNVALSRAREEMKVFASFFAKELRGNGGVQDLKDFLLLAEEGCPPKTSAPSLFVRTLKEDIERYGYECDTNVGTSPFRISVAVKRPESNDYLLAIVTDEDKNLTPEARISFLKTLKESGFPAQFVSAGRFYFERQKTVGELMKKLETLTDGGKRRHREREYRAVKHEEGRRAAYIIEGRRDAEIIAKLKELVRTEQPISEEFLKKRLLFVYGIRGGQRVRRRLDALISACNFPFREVMGKTYFFTRREVLLPEYYRTDKRGLRVREEDFTPFETLALIRSILEEEGSVYLEELTILCAKRYGIKPAREWEGFLSGCVEYGKKQGILSVAPSGCIALL